MDAIPKFDIKSDISEKPTTWIGHLAIKLFVLKSTRKHVKLVQLVIHILPFQARKFPKKDQQIYYLNFCKLAL